MRQIKVQEADIKECKENLIAREGEISKLIADMKSTHSDSVGTMADVVSM